MFPYTLLPCTMPQNPSYQCTTSPASHCTKHGYLDLVRESSSHGLEPFFVKGDQAQYRARPLHTAASPYSPGTSALLASCVPTASFWSSCASWTTPCTWVSTFARASPCRHQRRMSRTDVSWNMRWGRCATNRCSLGLCFGGAPLQATPVF